MKRDLSTLLCTLLLFTMDEIQKWNPYVCISLVSLHVTRVCRMGLLYCMTTAKHQRKAVKSKN